jgi:hypothetical protein
MIDALTPAKIAARLASTGVRTILISTSAVLDCKEPSMRAERVRAPTSLYGRFKAEAEEAILRHGDYGAVVRLTKVLTPNMRLMGDWIAMLRAGHEIAAIRDHRIAPLTIQHVVGGTSPMMELRIISLSGLAFPPRACGRLRRRRGGFHPRMSRPTPLSIVPVCGLQPALSLLSQKP